MKTNITRRLMVSISTLKPGDCFVCSGTSGIYILIGYGAKGAVILKSHDKDLCAVEVVDGTIVEFGPDDGVYKLENAVITGSY